MIDSLASSRLADDHCADPYMTAGFREWAERPSDPFGALPLRGVRLYNDNAQIIKGSAATSTPSSVGSMPAK